VANEAVRGQAVLDGLVQLLDLEQVEVDIFRGLSPAVRVQRVFGGQVAGQALVAAGRTVPPDRPVHSLHAYFLRPGDPKVPIVYLVDRIRDGRSFTTRRVVAIQHGQPIFNLSASFHVAETGVDHGSPMPRVPGPETLPHVHELMRGREGDFGANALAPRPIDLRYVDEPPWTQQDKGAREPLSRVWLRADGTLPDTPLLHVCLLAFASDLTLLDSILVHHGLSWNSISGASLDHAMWFHRTFRADEWLLYESASPSASGARGLATGRFWTADGRHIATVVQEGLIRPPRHRTPDS
jgi:acyl-CoA thioesterase II